MYRALFAPLLTIVLLAGTTCAYAQAPDVVTQGTTSDAVSTTTTTNEATSTDTAPTVIEDQKTFDTQLEAHRTTFKTKIQERVYNLMQNIAGRMRAAIDRLGNIADRMDARATILAQAGKDTATARPYIESARESLDAARMILSEDLERFAFSKDARGEFETARERVREVGQHIRDARESLRGGLRVLKDIDTNVSASEQATSTSNLEVQ